MIKYLNEILVYARNRPLVWDTILTTIWGAIGNSAGFFIPIFIAAFLGVTKLTDAFFLSYSLIFLLANIFSQTLETIIIPFIAENKHKNEPTGDFIGRILTTGTIAFSFVLLLFLFLVQPILSLATALTSEDIHLVYVLTLEITPFAILMVMSSVLAGAINAHKLFTIPAISPAIRATVVLIFIFLLHESIGVHSIAWGYAIGEMFRLIVLIFFIQKLRLFDIKISFSFDKTFLRFTKTSLYMLVGMFFSSLIPVINKFMASGTGQGNVSLLEYAEKIYMIPIVFLSSGLMVTVLSHWSDRYYSDDRIRFKTDISRALKIVGTLGLVITGCLFLSKGLVINLVYGYGKFPHHHIAIVEDIFGYYLIGLTPYLMSIVYARAFLTTKNTKILLIVSILMTVATVIANYIFLGLMGVAGIALANSVVLFFVLGIMAVIFRDEQK